MTQTRDSEAIRAAVRARYSAAAQAASTVGQQSGCCAPTTSDASAGCGGLGDASIITSDLYTVDEVAELPPAAVLASLGCGNPTALAALKPGEVVLDLGSGGGIDVLLSARRVGPTGYAYGLDMTDEMLALARQNKQKANATHVAFLKGRIEEI